VARGRGIRTTAIGITTAAGLTEAGLTEAELPTGPGIAWHTTDFKAGDALLFHSHTIHKALPNLTPDRLRLSTDNRYQRSDEEMEAGAMGSHYRLLEDLAEKEAAAA